MNIETPAEFITNRQYTEKDCYGLDSQVATLNVITDHQRNHQLAYAHFIRSEFGDNPDVESKPAAAPQQLVLHFSMAVVTILGAGLRPLDRAIQKNELKYVQRGTFSASKAERPTTVVTSVTITFNEGPA